ncbi:2Fe-2S iron-sulfur cluster binding domain-containing protein [Anopheles sinensis]|uniref:2Fe-2S iron-sulfur cluster binding domain-containing protein n=1 Tax=Anopheles sinensis TaxID=74873 RepID=A0A084VSK4_ANOSI|nr:2Fe-2S iron-sulfur cluster binding domain-containing protein [Anopheles sinensis]
MRPDRRCILLSSRNEGTLSAKRCLAATQILSPTRPQRPEVGPVPGRIRRYLFIMYASQLRPSPAVFLETGFGHSKHEAPRRKGRKEKPAAPRRVALSVGKEEILGLVFSTTTFSALREQLFLRWPKRASEHDKGFVFKWNRAALRRNL